ncbi:MAG: Rieske 2Fe-2S domain-containing protein [Nitrospirota bacterium]|nr:Rieske 2Fe-2S domain-containing protein [Nitrospirota bacterium]MDH5587803.1 Rieske 2Fe-2S domain-containing protein [Nitrospirota bacterium]
MAADFIPIAQLDDLPPGTCTSIETGEMGIALFNIDGHIYALDNTCPHAGGPLGEGIIEGEHIACPWHGWKFHIPTGICQKNPTPSLNVACYEVRVVEGTIQIARPAPPS